MHLNIFSKQLTQLRNNAKTDLYSLFQASPSTESVWLFSLYVTDA